MKWNENENNFCSLLNLKFVIYVVDFEFHYTFGYLASAIFFPCCYYFYVLFQMLLPLLRPCGYFDVFYALAINCFQILLSNRFGQFILNSFLLFACVCVCLCFGIYHTCVHTYVCALVWSEFITCLVYCFLMALSFNLSTAINYTLLTAPKSLPRPFSLCLCVGAAVGVCACVCVCVCVRPNKSIRHLISYWCQPQTVDLSKEFNLKKKWHPLAFRSTSFRCTHSDIIYILYIS